MSLNNEHEFYVLDNGIGIRIENFENVFQIYKRINRKDQYEGTGIGLALCHKILSLHYRRIWVESKEGQGSKFSFTLPKNLEKK